MNTPKSSYLSITPVAAITQTRARFADCRYRSMEIRATVNDQRLTSDKARARSTEELHRAHERGSELVALDNARLQRDVLELVNLHGVALDSVAQGEPGRHRVDEDSRSPYLFGECSRKGHHRSLACHVMEQVRDTLKRCA